jgi:hypothetical protein
MNKSQLVGESRDGPHWHSMRDQHYGNTTLSGSEVECDAVRVAMVRRHCEIEAPILENIKVPLVVGDELNYAECLEELVAPIEPARQLKDARQGWTGTPNKSKNGRNIRPPSESQFSPA